MCQAIRPCAGTVIVVPLVNVLSGPGTGSNAHSARRNPGSSG
jgi:hypothetical protein